MQKLELSKKEVSCDINFPASLVESTSPKKIEEKLQPAFSSFEKELQMMRVSLADTPSSESLMSLYATQAQGRAYFERASEMFRQFLKFSSNVSLMRQHAEFKFKQVEQETAAWLRANRVDEYRATKSGEERNNLILSYIPENLKEELIKWQAVESKTKVNYNIIKSYQEQFKSIREDVLVQLSIIKNLIMLGGINVDPEAMRAFKIVEASYQPTQRDYEEKRAENNQELKSMEQGVVSL